MMLGCQLPDISLFIFLNFLTLFYSRQLQHFFNNYAYNISTLSPPRTKPALYPSYLKITIYPKAFKQIVQCLDYMMKQRQRSGL